MNPTYDDIQKANSMKNEKIRKTALVYSPTFSMLTESKVYLKSEFQQKTGAFKIRGAYYKIQTLTDEEKQAKIQETQASIDEYCQG